jgi:pimeloyl-ACP methyl ester carboxylesterase
MSFVAVFAAAYAGVVILAFAVHRFAIYPAPPDAREPVLAGATLLRIAAPGGATVFALHAPAPAGAPTLVYFHGNGEQLADVVPVVWRLAGEGVGVLAVEYPGYGLARAERASERALYSAAETALRHLSNDLGVGRDRVVLLGQSLGSGVATEMATRGLGQRLILLSPYTSIVDMASRLAPVLPARVYVQDRFDNLAKAPGVHLPVLVVHGAKDELIPLEMGRRLAAAFPRATFLTLPDAHHNDLFADAGTNLFGKIAHFARDGL